MTVAILAQGSLRSSVSQGAMEELEEHIVEEILSEWHPDFWQEVEPPIRMMLMSRLEPGRLCFWNIHTQLTMGVKKLVLEAWRGATRRGSGATMLQTS